MQVKFGTFEYLGRNKSLAQDVFTDFKDLYPDAKLFAQELREEDEAAKKNDPKGLYRHVGQQDFFVGFGPELTLFEKLSKVKSILQLFLTPKPWDKEAKLSDAEISDREKMSVYENLLRSLVYRDRPVPELLSGSTFSEDIFLREVQD